MKKEINLSARLSHTMIYIILTFGAIIMIIPFVWMFLTAFKTFPETMKLPIKWLPDHFMLDNFTEVLQRLNFSQYYINTIITTTCITCLQILICSMAAYGFARLNAPGKNIIFIFVLSMLMIPIQMTMLPSYVLLNKMGMINTRWVLIIPQLFSAYGTFFLRQFFSSLPKELEESARIDGCSYFRCYWNIIMPLCGTAVAAFAIFTVLWAWNDLLWPLIMTSSERIRVLSVGMATLVGQFHTKNNILMAASVMVTMPMIILFIIFQKQFISSIATAGMKL